MNETLTIADVARLLHHPAPESRAAARKVARLVSLGLPVVPHVRPPVFVRDRVLAWLAATGGATEDTATVEPKRPRRSRPAPASAGLTNEIAELRASLRAAKNTRSRGGATGESNSARPETVP